MEGTVTIGLSEYERLKRDSDELKKLADNPDGYVRIYEHSNYGYTSYILVRFRQKDDFVIEAYQLNQGLMREIESLKTELRTQQAHKKQWWQIWK